MLNLNSQRLFVVLLSGFLAANIGCSARVELERTNSTEAAKAEIITAEVDFPPHPRQPSPPTEPPPQPAAPPVNPRTISGNTIIVNYRGGDSYYHSETHIHLDQSPPPRVKERIVIHRDAEPNRQLSEECERLAREHRERVKKWRESPGTMGQ
jgi:hypothetical protein